MLLKKPRIFNKRTNPKKDSKESAVRSQITRNYPKELGIGEITLKDIVKELEKPGRDPREDLPKPNLKNRCIRNERSETRNEIKKEQFVMSSILEHL